MKITLESTDDIVSLSGVQCRVWVGETPGGKRIMAYVHRIAVRADDNEELSRELRECERPGWEQLKSLEKHLGKPSPEE